MLRRSLPGSLHLDHLPRPFCVWTEPRIRSGNRHRRRPSTTAATPRRHNSSSNNNLIHLQALKYATGKPPVPSAMPPTTPPPELIDGKPRPPNIPAFFADSKDATDFEAHWDRLWKVHWTPWDRGGPSMALHDLLRDRPELFSSSPNKKALVPGAGRGHDVLLLASFGFDAYGLDLSPDAAVAARENEAKNGGLEVYKTRGPRHGKVTWLTGDYFSYDFKDVGPFDLIYDYTFLCALPLELRPKWSKAMRDNLAPNGKLVCLEFPTTKPTSAPGPPFALPSTVYEALLGRPGEEIPYDDDKAVDASKLGPESPDGLARVMRITPERSFSDGYDENSKVIDRLSVWCHGKSQS